MTPGPSRGARPWDAPIGSQSDASRRVSLEGAVRWAHVVLLVLGLLLISAANARWSERLQVNGGLGWDGLRYADVVRDPRGAVFGKLTDSYTIQRILPGVVVRGLIESVGARPTDANIVRGFLAFDTLLILLSGVLWGAVARRVGLSRRAFVVGAVGLFVNYAVVKQLPFYATMTDTAALGLGMAVVYFHAARSVSGLVVCGLVAAFTWHVALVLILPLILWPRGTGVPVHEGVTRPGTLIAAGFSAAIVASFLFVYVVLDRRSVGYGPVAPVVSWLIPVSVAAFAAVWYAGLRSLLRGMDVDHVVRLIRQLTVARTGIVIVLVVGVQVAVHALASPTRPPVIPLPTFLAIMAFTPLTRPLISLVAHAIYFGPWVILMIMLWPRIGAIARAEGAGVVAFVAGGAILGVLPESRQSSFVVPMFVLLTVLAAEAAAVPSRVHVVIALAAVVLSKFWLIIGPGELFTELRLYFMNHGVYMTDREYVAHGLPLAALVVAILMVLRARPPALHGSGMGSAQSDIRGRHVAVP